MEIEVFEERAAGALQGGDIDFFAVKEVIFPTPPEDALPFVRQAAHGGVMARAFEPLLLIVSDGPTAVADTFTGRRGQGATVDRERGE
jgi:hypothetical protein